jgi:glycosyltransferase involved in cell wall biosynthesis
MNPDKTAGIRPLVSIVVPVYNGGRYFEACLESILNQTYQNWECIINNNCSEDDTLATADRFASKDGRFKVFSNDTFLRMIHNWNMGCSRISPESRFLKVLGADDWLFPESIEKMVDVMEKHPNVGICSSYRLNDRVVDMYGLNMWDGNVYKGKDILYRQLTRTMDVTGSNSTVLFSVEHLKKLPHYPVIFTDKTIHEDTELEYELMSISDVGFVFQVLSFTRRHPEAETSTVVYRHNTLLHFNEKVLWDYKGDDKVLNRLYRQARREYANFMFWKTLAFDRETTQWHRQRLERKLTVEEYITGVITKNKISKFSKRIFKKMFG